MFPSGGRDTLDASFDAAQHTVTWPYLGFPLLPAHKRDLIAYARQQGDHVPWGLPQNALEQQTKSQNEQQKRQEKQLGG